MHTTINAFCGISVAAHVHLSIQQADVFAAENFGDKGAARPKYPRHNHEGCQDELRLHVLVHVVQTRHCTNAAKLERRPMRCIVCVYSGGFSKQPDQCSCLTTITAEADATAICFVPSGAPSDTTRSAWCPSKCPTTAAAVLALVMSPCTR
jgi:hypothetical protein